MCPYTEVAYKIIIIPLSDSDKNVRIDQLPLLSVVLLAQHYSQSFGLIIM